MAPLRTNANYQREIRSKAHTYLRDGTMPPGLDDRMRDNILLEATRIRAREEQNRVASARIRARQSARSQNHTRSQNRGRSQNRTRSQNRSRNQR